MVYMMYIYIYGGFRGFSKFSCSGIRIRNSLIYTIDKDHSERVIFGTMELSSQHTARGFSDYSANHSYLYLIYYKQPALTLNFLHMRCTDRQTADWNLFAAEFFFANVWNCKK